MRGALPDASAPADDGLTAPSQPIDRSAAVDLLGAELDRLEILPFSNPDAAFGPAVELGQAAAA